jgi:hypothetical protein
MIQVTLGSGPTQVTSSLAAVQQIIIQNNAAHACRAARSPNVSATSGIALSPGGGSLNWNVLGPLCAWYLFGTAGDVIDVEFQ